MRARPGEREFCDWFIELGNGTLRSVLPEAIPGQIDIPSDCTITDNIVDAIFPDFNNDRPKNIILTPINESTKIKLSPSDTELPFKFQRTQFPIRLAYCMTINKSQGQTFN